MPRPVLLLLFLVLVFAGGGLLAPWLWWGMQALAGPHGEGWVRDLAEQPFLRYVHRCVLGLALVGLWPLARLMGARTWRDVGLSDAGRAGGRWVGGFAVGAAMFGLTLGVELLCGWRSWREGMEGGRLAGAVVMAGASGLAVGTLEEILFRGVLCRGLAGPRGRWGWAILVSSLVYAWTHFLARGSKPEAIGWLTGGTVVWGMVQESFRTHAWLPGFPTLVLAGVLLGLLLRDTGAIHTSMGLHTGWVFWIKLRGALTARIAEPGAQWGESRISAGWTGLVAVTLALAGYLVWRRRERRPGEGPGVSLRP